MYGPARIIFLLLLLEVFIAVSCLKNNVDFISVCSNSTDLEPSILEIFESLIPPVVSEVLLERLQIFTVLKKYIPQSAYIAVVAGFKRIRRVTLPYKSLISDGIFNIDMTTDHFFFRDVLLIQKSSFTTHTVCSFLPMRYHYIRSFLCECSIGQKLSRKDIAYFSARFGDFNTKESRRWCVRNPCTNKSSRDGVCSVVVDPFRTTCIAVLKPSLTAHSNDKEESTDENVMFKPLTNDLIKFNLSVPFINEKVYGIDKIFSMFQNDENQRKTDSSDLKNEMKNEKTHSPDFLYRVEILLNYIGALMPMYLFYFIVGSTFLLFTEDIASNPVLQCIISACFGLLIFWLAMAVEMYVLIFQRYLCYFCAKSIFLYEL